MIEIYHQEEFDRFVTKVAFLDRQNRMAYNFATGEARTIPIGESLPKDFILEIPTELFNQVVKGFAEVASEKGLKLDGDLKREGQLEATKYHLEDLRKMLKL